MNTQNNDGSLDGRLVIVTGASSGVGYATVRRLVQTEGATVVAVARRRLFRIEALGNQVGSDRLMAVTADVSAPGQAEALAAQVVARFGRIDGFVHAVNRLLRLTALEVHDHEFDLTMQVNVKSALYGVQAFAPTLRRQGSGAIVIYNPTPPQTEAFVASEAVYSAAAHALSALTGGWRRQLEGAGVIVCEVAPTPADEDLLGGSPLPHDQLLVEALRGSTGPGGEVIDPVVLSSRGGLTLARF